MLKKLGKQSILYLIIIIVIATLVCIGVVYYFSKEPEITVQEPPEDRIKTILKTLGTSTPGEEGREVSEEELKNLGGSGENGKDVDKDILETLGTVPE